MLFVNLLLPATRPAAMALQLSYHDLESTAAQDDALRAHHGEGMPVGATRFTAASRSTPAPD